MNKKICDDDKINKILEYNRRFSKTRQVKKSLIRNYDNYDKKILHPERENDRPPSLLKRGLFFILFMIIFLTIIYVINTKYLTFS